jgi:hypothetical protein
MTINNILENLQQYQAFDANEKRMVDETIAFIQSQPQCLERTLTIGHVTASAWITDPSRQYVLLTHHKKLYKWFQLGGHADGEPDLVKVAVTEAHEESGLTNFSLISEAIFDVDVHLIPARLAEPAHFHYDIRFLLETDKNQTLIINHESKALAWIAINEVENLNDSESIMRMVRKHQGKFKC